MSGDPFVFLFKPGQIGKFLTDSFVPVRLSEFMAELRLLIWQSFKSLIMQNMSCQIANTHNFLRLD